MKSRKFRQQILGSRCHYYIFLLLFHDTSIRCKYGRVNLLVFEIRCQDYSLNMSCVRKVQRTLSRKVQNTSNDTNYNIVSQYLSYIHLYTLRVIYINDL